MGADHVGQVREGIGGDPTLCHHANMAVRRALVSTAWADWQTPAGVRCESSAQLPMTLDANAAVQTTLGHTHTLRGHFATTEATHTHKFFICWKSPAITAEEGGSAPTARRTRARLTSFQTGSFMSFQTGRLTSFQMGSVMSFRTGIFSFRAGRLTSFQTSSFITSFRMRCLTPFRTGISITSCRTDSLASFRMRRSTSFQMGSLTSFQKGSFTPIPNG